MTIREERPEEFPALYDFIKEVFATAAVKDGTEQDFTDRLRASGGYLPELALVAEEGSEIAGHVMLTKLDYHVNGQACGALVLAPLSVALTKRGQGVGGKLAREALDRARKLGYKAVFLCGNPAYYSRFGFRPIAEFGMTNLEGTPIEYVQACELLPGALSGARGGTVKLPG